MSGNDRRQQHWDHRSREATATRNAGTPATPTSPKTCQRTAPAGCGGPRPRGTADGWRPERAIVRRSAGTWTLQSTLQRHGLGPVAGVDEAGRGAGAGPLVVAGFALGRPGNNAELGSVAIARVTRLSAAVFSSESLLEEEEE